MDIFTLYAGQGDLAAIRSGKEAVIIEAHMPTCEGVTAVQIEKGLDHYLERSNVRGLVITGLDKDHACPAGVDSILTRFEPDWVMYPTYYKATEAATEVFAIIDRHVKRRLMSSRPLLRKSVRVDRCDHRYFTDLADEFAFELFSPHMEDMDSSNNSSIVLKVTGLDSTGFSYLVTGDTESGRWETINRIFGHDLKSDVMSAPHHGARTGVNAETLLLVEPNTVLISAGVDNSYGHPYSCAVTAYQAIAEHVFSTHAALGSCLFTRRSGTDFETTLVRHFEPELSVV